MAELKFDSFVVFPYHNHCGASFTIEGQKVIVAIDEAAEAEMRAICFRAYERQRQALADAILTAQPLALEAPKAEYTEFEEVVRTAEVPV